MAQTIIFDSGNGQNASGTGSTKKSNIAENSAIRAAEKKLSHDNKLERQGLKNKLSASLDKKNGQVSIETVGMYSASRKQWNVQAGCDFGCHYCEKSFQASLKRQKWNCPDCYNYSPHAHPERLDISLPRTNFLEFIFTCSHGDISACEDSFFAKIIERVQGEKEKNFLFQSKSPKKAFARKGIKIPNNVILGTTLETNRSDLCRKFTNAPPPEIRFKQLRDIEHPIKMVTLEPIMDFDIDILLRWISEINPRLAWLGYDSKNCGLIEPPLEKFKELHWQLGVMGIATILKNSTPSKGK